MLALTPWRILWRSSTIAPSLVCLAAAGLRCRWLPACLPAEGLLPQFPAAGPTFCSQPLQIVSVQQPFMVGAAQKDAGTIRLRLPTHSGGDDIVLHALPAIQRQLVCSQARNPRPL